MSKGLCQHILVLKPEKVANHFAKAKNYCTGNKKHTEAPLGLCLTCGEVRCDNLMDQCTYQHSYGTKHPLVYKIQDQAIYCFHCKEVISEEVFLSRQCNKKDKIIEVVQKIMAMSSKLGEKAEMEVAKTEGKSKKNQKDVEKKEFSQSEVTYLLKKEEESGHEKKSLKLDVFGLRNLGNTCFFNSILQCLYSCQELHRSYSNFHIDTTKAFGKVGEINLLFKKYLHNTQKCFSPKSLFSWAGKVKGVYRHYDQQDAQQFLAIILNGLIDGERFWHGVKQVHGEKLTESQKLFGFYLASRLQCLECNKVSWCFDFSLQLAVQLTKTNSKSFPLPKGEINKEESNFEGLSYPPPKTTDTFLDNFFVPEALTSQNYFLCEGCGAGKAWRKFYIYDPPETLIISLKRFNNNLSKNNASVRPPYRLDLEGTCLTKGPLVYQLFAISQHSGSSHGGHYIAYTRRGSDWYYFSDSNSKGQSWQKVRMGQPYILFYKRIQ